MSGMDSRISSGERLSQCQVILPRVRLGSHRRSFIIFFSLARGSLVEIETQLMIAENLGYLPSNQTRALLEGAPN